MEESEAEAIAQAVLRPDPKVQEEARRKKAYKEWWIGEKRKLTWLMVIGFGAGAVIALYLGQRVSTGGTWGALSGGVAGWLWLGWRWRRHKRRRVA